MFADSVPWSAINGMPPGPGLGEALTSMDLAALGSAELADVVAAQVRQVAWAQARELAWLLETARAYEGEMVRDRARIRALAGNAAPRRSSTAGGVAEPGPQRWGMAAVVVSVGSPEEMSGWPVRSRTLSEFSADLVAMVLHRSASYVQGELWLAECLIDRLPSVFQALSDGQIDKAKAAAFCHAVRLLDPAKARALADREIERAPSLTLTQLRARLRRQVVKIDPDLARRETLHDLTQRRVFVTPYTDGTAQLCGINLPPATAMAAYDRVDRIARAARSAGDVRTLDQLRADAVLDLLRGHPFMPCPSLDTLTAEADTAARDLNQAHDDPDDTAGTRPPPPPRHRTSTRRASAGTGRVSAGTGRASGDTTPHSRPDGSDSPPGGGGSPPGGGGAPPGWNGSEDRAAATSDTEPWWDPDPRDDPDERASQADLDLLATLFPDPEPIRLDENTAPHTNHTATRTNDADADADDPNGDSDSEARNSDGEARDDADDEPIGAATLGITPTTPATHPATESTPIPPPLPPPIPPPLPAVASDDPRACVCGGIQPAPRPGVVNIEIKLSTLAWLDDHPGIIPGYGPVIADIARQIAHEQKNSQWRYNVVDNHGRLLYHGITHRRPTTVEAAFTRARDKTCIAPGCTRPATTCDLDHIWEWANGGPSLRHNLATTCRHHHRLRHEHGHHITYTTDGTPTWTAPNGTVFAITPHGYYRIHPNPHPTNPPNDEPEPTRPGDLL